MWTWIVIGALYLVGMGSFQLLGGLGAAGDAFRQWGEAVARRRRPSTSS